MSVPQGQKAIRLLRITLDSRGIMLYRNSSRCYVCVHLVSASLRSPELRALLRLVWPPPGASFLNLAILLFASEMVSGLHGEASSTAIVQYALRHCQQQLSARHSHLSIIFLSSAPRAPMLYVFKTSRTMPFHQKTYYTGIVPCASTPDPTPFPKNTPEYVVISEQIRLSSHVMTISTCSGLRRIT